MFISRSILIILVVMIVSVTVVAPAEASIRYVNAATGDDTNPGDNWATAYRNVQAALLTAFSGDEIWVAAGTYEPDQGLGITPGNRLATFQLISGVALYGGFAGTETVLSQRNSIVNVTILSGDLNANDAPVACTQNAPDCDSFGHLCVGGFCIIASNNSENSYHVVTGSGTNVTAILDGFTITAGNANGVSDFHGGGMYNAVSSSSPTVTYCTFSGNSASSLGGGMFNQSGSNPTVTYCTFRGNSAFRGGGMMNFSFSSPTVTDCTFAGNSADYGGGLSNNVFSSPTVANCTFSGNSANVEGGGMSNLNNSSPTVTNCTFSNNRADIGGALSLINTGNVSVINGRFFGNQVADGQAGAIWCFDSNPVDITNCVFSGNRAAGTSNGAAVYFHGNSLGQIVNCTFSDNSADGSGGGLTVNGSASVLVANSILWGNSDAGGMGESAQIHTFGGTPVVNFSIVQGGWTGSGGNNLNVDPLFFAADGLDGVVGTLDDDLRLRAGSPAIDSGDDTAVPADTADLDGDEDTAEPIPYDLAGNARFNGIVDRGALENFTDCNHNGVDDATDVILETSQDCDSLGWPANDVPDECDIAACADLPACDDCNLNGIPDGCDIGLGVSEDLARCSNSPPTACGVDEDCPIGGTCILVDGVPDECAAFTGGCTVPGQEQFWTCPGNWPPNLNGGYPDDQLNDPEDRAGFSVLLPPGVDVVLDDDVVVPVFGSKHPIAPAIAPAKLTINPGITLGFNPPAIMHVNGQVVMHAGFGRNVKPSVKIEIGPQGSIDAEAAPSTGGSTAGPGPTEPALDAEYILLEGGDCAVPPCPGGQLLVGGSEVVKTEGDLTIDGTLAVGAACSLPGQGTVAGITPPPKLRLSDSAVLEVGAALTMLGAAGFENNSTSPVTVSGDWNNRSVRPDCFDSLNGTIRMGIAPMHKFETAATNLGRGIRVPGAPFGIGRLEIAAGPGHTVTFVDEFDNDVQGQSPCGEAQYVGTLVLEAGSAIVVDNCLVYYETLINQGGTITKLGCGDLLAAGVPNDIVWDPALNPIPWPNINPLATTRSLRFTVTGPAGPAKPEAIKVTMVDLQHPRPANLSAQPPPNYTTYDTRMNGVCVGGTLNTTAL